MRHYSAELQTAKQTLTTSKDLIEFTHSDFLCHLKVNRDTLALISRLWKSKNGERLTITANLFTKIVDYRSSRPGRKAYKRPDSTDSARCGGADDKIPPAPGTNQIAGFVQFRPLTSSKKDNNV